MKAENDHNNKRILIETSYNEAHFLGEALRCYQLQLEKDYGKNSEEERYISELLHAVRNPIVRED